MPSNPSASNNCNDICIWNFDYKPPLNTGWRLIYWENFSDDPDNDAVLSLPNIIERDAESLRRTYLSLIFDFGNLDIKGKSITDYLKLRDGFSYFWMTKIAEMNYGHSKSIYDAIRLIALEKFLNKLENPINKIYLGTQNIQLQKCIELFCSRKKISFVALSPSKIQFVKKRFNLFSCLKKLPYLIQGIIFLGFYLCERWSLRGIGIKEWSGQAGKLTFFSYFSNLDKRKLNQGQFYSSYWSELPEMIANCELPSRWLHHYVKGIDVSTTQQAAKILKRMNSLSTGMQAHVFLDSFISPSVIWRSVADWIKLIMFAYSSRKKIKHFFSELDLWPIFRDEWYDSLVGQFAIENILKLNLFESAIRSIPKQSLGLYLQENQTWEFALIHAWKKYNHGAIVGVPHSTVRFWDLRYFRDPRLYEDKYSKTLPLPNLIAINGKVMQQAYTKAEYPIDNLIEVEALRYFDINIAPRAGGDLQNSRNSDVKILILGDYLGEVNKRLLSLLVNSSPLLSKKIIFIFKPHPNCSIDPSDYPILRLQIKHDSVSHLVAECSIAISSPITSAAVDVYCAGKPVISYLDPMSLNLSPLRGLSGVHYVNSADQLAYAINEILECKKSSEPSINFFQLEPGMPRWKELIDRYLS